MVQKILLCSSRGLGNFRGPEASRPRTWPLRPRIRTSKCGLEDVLEAKDDLEDSTSVFYDGHFVTSCAMERSNVQAYFDRSTKSTAKATSSYVRSITVVKNARMNISHFHFILFNLKIFGEIVTILFIRMRSRYQLSTIIMLLWR